MLLRTCVFVNLVIASTAPLFAQIPAPRQQDFVFLTRAVTMPPLDSGQVSDELIGKVQATLSLSDTQVTALKTLLTMRSQAIEQISQAAIDSQKKLEDLLSQSNPNATDVGNAFLATRSVQDQLKAAEEKFRLDFRALLSTDQRTALDKLQAASDQTGSLMALGILQGNVEGDFGVGVAKTGPGLAIGFQRRLSKDR
jgi:uncharacterized membrane protein